MPKERDTTKRPSLSRRELLRGAAGMAALSQLPAALAKTTNGSRSIFAYVASSTEHSIAVFAAGGSSPHRLDWSRVQRVASPAPACVVLSDSCLYVANDVAAHGGLPRGSVQAFRVGADGRLTPLGCQPLSLSATHPRSIALSPDGKLLAVAAYGGGIYNLLPVAEDGCLSAPCAIFKEAGCGPQPALQSSAHPHTLRFLGPDLLLASDFGSDRIGVFSTEGGKLKRQAQLRTGEGSGPGACVVSPDGGTAYVWHHLAGALAVRRYHANARRFGEPLQQLPLGKPGAQGLTQAALAMHASGRMLYTARQGGDALDAWRVGPGTGLLTPAGSVALKGSQIEQIVAAHDQSCVFALDSASGSVWAIPTAPLTGEPGAATRVAEATTPCGMALKST